jgi:hypothetical protein
MSVTITKNVFATLDASIQATILAAINENQNKPKPKRIITDEQKAKMKAGREAAAAKKKSEIIDSPTQLAAPVLLMPPSDKISEPSPEKKKRGPKKLSDMTPEELLARKEKRAARKAEKASDSSEISEAEEVIMPAHPVVVSVVEKPKRVLSDEQKAKMKAGREAAAAKKKATSSTESSRSESPISAKEKAE